ncbi:MAG: MAPEG family protein [Alphaproteobacteria bacterium]
MFAPTFAVGIATAVLALLFLYLSYNVIRLRQRHKVELGTGGVSELEQAIRAHGNFAEYVPLALILLYACLGIGTHSLVIYIACALLLVGRFMHAFGLLGSRGVSQGRVLGWSATALVILGLSIACVVAVVRRI